ncbi:PadR family transcriptional regulator [Gandjariella thermophila]|uniref:PadR family transcriptional regulator n=1 Tax=Gandjariella thermophila TaxID=1931992 RepID=A0A4D4J4L3_9PSEU|nr:PadR family transcriptional regulator [Gandjariella thermophila]GDY29569.1 PadR family transcriptional regulator [Gandjariella thermophila]
MSLRHALLGLLAHGSASGYDLLGTFQGSLANVWPATQSQLYGELNRLADAGLISVVAEGPRGRKEYAITDTGRAELQRWLTEEEPERNRRNDMLLRVFLLDLVEPAQARAFLDREAALAAERHESLRKLDESIEWDDSPLSRYGRLTLEWGLRATAMHREWAEWAAARIDAGGRRRGG